MDQILFLPLNQNHVYIFKEIISVLGMEYTVLCHDRIAEARPHHTESLLKQFELAYRHFPHSLARLPQEGIGRRLHHFFVIRNMVRSLLDELRPALIVLALDNDPLAQILISEGHKHCIPSVMVPEGLLKPHELSGKTTYTSDFFYRILRSFGIYIKYIRYGSGDCNHIFVSGKRAFDILLKLGVSENRMSIVGQQKYDYFLQKIRDIRPRKSDSPVFLYAASIQIFQNESEIQLLRYIVETAKRLKYPVIAKLHPRTLESTDKLLSLLGENTSGTLKVLKEGYDTFDLLKTVDIVITISSAIVLEALMMNRECIVASYLAGNSRFDYDEYDAIFTIEAPKEIPSLMRLSVTRPKTWESKSALLEDEIYSLDGKAAERTVHQMHRLIRSRTYS